MENRAYEAEMAISDGFHMEMTSRALVVGHGMVQEDKGSVRLRVRGAPWTIYKYAATQLLPTAGVWRGNTVASSGVAVSADRHAAGAETPPTLQSYTAFALQNLSNNNKDIIFDVTHNFFLGWDISRRTPTKITSTQSPVIGPVRVGSQLKRLKAPCPSLIDTAFSNSIIYRTVLQPAIRAQTRDSH